MKEIMSYEDDSETSTKESCTNRDISPNLDLNFNLLRNERRHSNSIIHSLRDFNDYVDALGDAGNDDNQTTCSKSKAKLFFSYNMSHKKRGIFVIFNHKEYHLKLEASKRDGTDRDRDNLAQIAQALGFKVFIQNDLRVRELLNVMEECARQNYVDCDCFACAILTHGDSSDILYAHDGKYSIQELFAPLQNCQTLVGKPKLFFVQACRGNRLDHGVLQSDCLDARATDGSSDSGCVAIPVEADFFIGYSTVEGYYAWRNGENGSWFIQALCHCLEKYSKNLELMQIMTRVNRMVAYDFESTVLNSPGYHKKKQMPSIVTRLTGDVYFGPQQPKPSEENCEEPDGKVLFKRKKSLQNNSVHKTDGPHSANVKKQTIKTKLKLNRLSQRKMEIELEEEKLKEQLLEHELAAL